VADGGGSERQSRVLGFSVIGCTHLVQMMVEVGGESGV